MLKALNYLVYLLFRGFVLLGNVLPMRPTFAVSAWLATIAYYLLGSRRKTALRNLEMAFGDKLTARERDRLARQAMVNLVYSAVEFLFMWRIAENWQEHFIFEGDEVIEQNIINKRPFFVFGGHLGGWMMLAMVGERWKKFNVRGGCVMRPQRNPYIDAYIRGLAKRYGDSSFIGTRGTGKVIEKMIMDGGLVGFYMDQESKRKQGILVDFFGMPAYSHVVPGYLAWKHRIPMYPFWIVRTKPGYFHVIYREPIKMDYTGDKEKDIREVTQRIVKEVEDTIRQHPEQWLWFHNRWKRTLGEDQPKKSRKKKIESGDYLTSAQLLKMMDQEIGEKKDENTAGTA
jgi:KDO2-lipid IV(A) lauroyltransferase